MTEIEGDQLAEVKEEIIALAPGLAKMLADALSMIGEPKFGDYWPTVGIGFTPKIPGWIPFRVKMTIEAYDDDNMEDATREDDAEEE